MEREDKAMFSRGFREIIHKLDEISKGIKKLCTLVNKNNELLTVLNDFNNNNEEVKNEYE